MAPDAGRTTRETRTTPDAIPMGHVRSLACGHVVNAGFGPGRTSAEKCRNCTIADGEMGITDPDRVMLLYPEARSPIDFRSMRGRPRR